MIGRTVSHFQILEKLGEGGMGVVYKARDTRLDRFVAIKTLPAKMVADPARKQRFIREAKAASALSHPNIIHIYEIDHADGVDFISMEFVNGKTLERLISRRGMGLSDALNYGAQIADALAAAHSAGIIHRDLKPANVIVNEKGLAKVLDFGLAKLMEVTPDADESTRTLQSPATEEGTVVGTVAYMSPEQSEGKKVDVRSDIFSFGSMLYEMLTGRRAFQRDTTASTIAAVLLENPKPATQIVEELPDEIDRILRRCLRKDPAERFQHMDDLRVALKELKQESDSGVLRTAQSDRKVRGRWNLRIAAALVALLAAGSGALWFMRSTPEPEIVSVPLTTYPGTEEDPSFSPDGTQVAFVWCKDVAQKLCNVYIKQVGVEPPSNMTGAPAHEYNTAWSPDGRLIAFVRAVTPDKAALIIIPQRGGRERVLAEFGRFDMRRVVNGPFLAWTPDSKWIAVSELINNVHSLVLYSAIATGEKRILTSPPERGLGDTGPAFSPDGQTLAFQRSSGTSDIYLLRLDTEYRPQGTPERLGLDSLRPRGPAWMPDGRELIILSSVGLNTRLWRTLIAASSTPRRLAFADNNVHSSTVSVRTNRLAYSSGANDSNIWRIELRGPSGNPSPPTQLIASTHSDNQPAYSPDGKRIAFVSDRSGASELWVSDGDGANPTQLTFQGRMIMGPRWSWDGKHLAFFGRRLGDPLEAFVISASGGEPRRIEGTPSGSKWPYWSRDGKWVYIATDGENAIRKIALAGGQSIRIAPTGDVPQESPDGKYIYFHTGWPNPMTIWRTGINGGEPAKILESVHSSGNWTVTEKGIYFFRVADEKGHSELCLYEFSTGRTKTLTSITNGIEYAVAAPPEGNVIAYSQLDVAGSDLMLVENFR